MSIKDKFISELIDRLNNVNEQRIYYNKETLDVCFMVSVIDQQIEKCKELMEDLSNNEWSIGIYEDDKYDGYTNGEIRIHIIKSEPVDYCYCIEFLYDERYWGYCQCTPDDEGYNSKHKCCGNGCDWIAPAFSITKETFLGDYKWEGYEKDYWEYEEKFHQDKKNKNEEVERHKREQEKQHLLEQIKILQNKLKELEKQIPKKSHMN
jgi:hypothetical protein